MSQASRKILVIFAAFMLILSGIVSLPSFSAKAAEGIDLTAQLNGTSEGQAGGEYTYDLVFRNIGTDDAKNSTFVFEMPAGSEYLTATCVSEQNAVCPANITVPQGKITVGQNIVAVIPSLPEGGIVRVTVKGKFPVTSSASLKLSINPAAGVVDGDLNSNVVNQQARLHIGSSVTVEKVQDLETVTIGNVRTYTVTYTNTGFLDLPNLKVKDLVRIPEFRNLPGLSFSWNVQCDQSASGVAPCPEWADGVEKIGDLVEEKGLALFEGEINLPAKQKLVLKIPVRVDASCSNVGETLETRNVASQEGAVGFKLAGSETTEVVGNITGFKACDVGGVSISKTQDKAEVGLNEVRTYRVVYENSTNVDVTDLKVSEYYESPLASGNSIDGKQLVGGGLEWSVSCDPAQTSANACPDWANGESQQRSELRWADLFQDGGSVDWSGVANRTIDLKAGQKITFVIPLKTVGTCRALPDFEVKNTAKHAGAADVNIDTPRETSLAGKVINIPGCPQAELLVEKTQTKDVYKFGEDIDYTLTYTNNGPADINSVFVRDDMWLSEVKGVAFKSGIFTYSCDAEASTAACPFATEMVRVQDVDSFNKGYIDVFGHYADIRNGEKLVINVKYQLDGTCTPTPTTLSIENKASFSSGNVEYIGKSATVKEKSVFARVLCNDVSTTTTVSNAKPDPGTPITITSVIGNTLGVAENVPVTITVPRVGGFILPKDAKPTCETQNAGTCPAEWTWDENTRTFTGNVETFPAGATLTITVSGTAGIVEVGGESYRATTRAASEGDRLPGDENANRSDNTFVIQNFRVTPTVVHTLVVSPENGAPADLTFSGKLVCQNSGTHDVSVTIPAGQKTAQFTTLNPVVWKGDSCQLTVKEAANLPAGYAWLPPAGNQHETIANFDADKTFPFEWSITKAVVVPQPLVIDKCGTNNVKWEALEKQPVSPVGAYTWKLTDTGALEAIISPGYVAQAGTPTVFELPADKGVECATITVNTWTDPLVDGEGTRTDLSEPISAIKIVLVQVAADGAEKEIASAETTDGTYIFRDLVVGKYFVRFGDAPAGYRETKATKATNPATAADDSDNKGGFSEVVTVVDGQNLVIDAGYVKAEKPLDPPVVKEPVKPVPPKQTPVKPKTPQKPQLANTGVNSVALPLAGGLLALGFVLVAAKRRYN